MEFQNPINTGITYLYLAAGSLFHETYPPETVVPLHAELAQPQACKKSDVTQNHGMISWVSSECPI